MATYEDFLVSSIEKLSLQRKVIWASDRKFAKLQCVSKLHKGGNENTPSLQVTLKKGKYSLGSSHCFSCGIHYKTWNELTKALYRPDLASNDDIDWEEPDITGSFFSQEIDKAVNEEDEIVDPVLFKDLSAGTLWNSSQTWRGIQGKILNAINAKMYFDTALQVPMLYLPCKVNKREVGGIRARIKKQDKFNYINTGGSWVMSRGLFCFDHACKMMRKQRCKTIVAVEGARDALNFYQNNIPTVAILGSNNFNETKAEILLSSGCERVITAFDPDSAGDKAKKLVYNYLKDQVEVVNFSFAKWEQKLGMEGLDPGNAGPEVIKSVQKHLI